MDILTVVRPESVSGLFDVLKYALNYLDIGIKDVNSDKCKKLVGLGTDANIAGRNTCSYHGCTGCGVLLIAWN